VVEEAQGTPLIDPEKIKPIVAATQVDVPSVAAQVSRSPRAGSPGKGDWVWGTGRRKSSVARVRIRPGKGVININGREVDAYFPSLRDRGDVRAPLVATKSEGKYDVFISVKGGGNTGQAGAVMLGLARALIKADSDSYSTLKDKGYLTRDSRMVERKKYGQRGARRRFQFSKR